MPKQLESQPAATTASRLSPGLRRGMSLAATLIVGAGALGCGSSTHSTTSTTATAITKAEFLAKANAICASSDPALSAGAAKLATLRSDAQIASVVRTVYVPAIEAQIAQIRTLGSPAGDQTAVSGMLQMALADLAKLKHDPALVNTDVFADFAKAAHPYGMTACAPTS